MAKPAKKTGPKKAKRNVPNGVAHIQSTFNNTIVSITDTSGEVISWSSAGASGFKGARKGTPFAAQTAAEAAARRALEQGMRQIEVLVRGPGSGRETAIRALQVAGLEITLSRDVTPRLSYTPPSPRAKGEYRQPTPACKKNTHKTLNEDDVNRKKIT